MLPFWVTMAVFFGSIPLLLVDSTRRAEQRAERQKLRARQALARSACPTCGTPIGESAAATIAADSARAAEQAIYDGMAEGKQVTPRRDWFGPCPSCGARLSFNPRTRKLRLDASA